MAYEREVVGVGGAYDGPIVVHTYCNSVGFAGGGGNQRMIDSHKKLLRNNIYCKAPPPPRIFQLDLLDERKLSPAETHYRLAHSYMLNLRSEE